MMSSCLNSSAIHLWCESFIWRISTNNGSYLYVQNYYYHQSRYVAQFQAFYTSFKAIYLKPYLEFWNKNDKTFRKDFSTRQLHVQS